MANTKGNYTELNCEEAWVRLPVLGSGFSSKFARLLAWPQG
jgi:hypothetical protein